jgi:hypothetical protein
MAVFVLLPALMLTFLGTDEIRVTTWLQSAGMLAVIAAAEAKLSLSLCELMVPGCRHRPSPKALLLTVLPVYAVAALLLYPEDEVLLSGEAGQQCARVAGLSAVPAAVVLWMLARRGAVLSWATTGATIGLLSALAGVSVLVFSCSTPEVIHVLTWHAGALLICTISGLLLGKLITRT